MIATITGAEVKILGILEAGEIRIQFTGRHRLHDNRLGDAGTCRVMPITSLVPANATEVKEIAKALTNAPTFKDSQEAINAGF